MYVIYFEELISAFNLNIIYLLTLPSIIANSMELFSI